MIKNKSIILTVLIASVFLLYSASNGNNGANASREAKAIFSLYESYEKDKNIDIIIKRDYVSENTDEVTLSKNIVYFKKMLKSHSGSIKIDDISLNRANDYKYTQDKVKAASNSSSISFGSQSSKTKETDHSKESVYKFTGFKDFKDFEVSLNNPENINARFTNNDNGITIKFNRLYDIDDNKLIVYLFHSNKGIQAWLKFDYDISSGYAIIPASQIYSVFNKGDDILLTMNWIKKSTQTISGKKIGAFSSFTKKKIIRF